MTKTFSSVNETEEKRNFDTGSLRNSREGKGRFDLIPAYPLKRLAQHYENGARVYPARNWEKGQPLMGYIDSALRHLNNFKEGDRSEDHMSAAVWNLFSFIATEDWIDRGILPKKLNDVPTYHVCYAADVCAPFDAVNIINELDKPAAGVIDAADIVKKTLAEDPIEPVMVTLREPRIFTVTDEDGDYEDETIPHDRVKAATLKGTLGELCVDPKTLPLCTNTYVRTIEGTQIGSCPYTKKAYYDVHGVGTQTSQDICTKTIGACQLRFPELAPIELPHTAISLATSTGMEDTIGAKNA